VFDKNASLVYVSFIQAWENVVHNIAHAEFFNKCIIIERINVFNSFLMSLHLSLQILLLLDQRRRPRFSINCQKMWHLTTLNKSCHFFHFSRSLCTAAKLSPDEGEKNRLEFPILPTINFSLETFSDPFCYPTEWTWGGGQNGEFHLKDLHLDTHHHQSSAHF